MVKTRQMKSSVLSEEAKLDRVVNLRGGQGGRRLGRKKNETKKKKATDINKCKQRWPWDVIKKNSMSRPHGSETYCYLESAGVIACEHQDDIHQFWGVLLENVDGGLPGKM